MPVIHIDKEWSESDGIEYSVSISGPSHFNLYLPSGSIEAYWEVWRLD